jgi:8-amino-7-oxononanoate synthase
MTIKIPEYLSAQRKRRGLANSERVLRVHRSAIDLSSNDYLGIARKLASPDVVSRVLEEVRLKEIGATGSRLVSGNFEAHEELEGFLASYHQAESALLFGSGYEANIGLLSAIAGRADTILFDEFIHASMRDGIRLSYAKSLSFRHNDLEDLRKKAALARGDIFIAIESLYSMDGDLAPLVDLCQIANELGAFLIVDEAHSNGVYGPKGAGLVSEFGLHDRVFARVHTFGKALGYKGACVLGSHELRQHLINHARSFVYATAPDLVTLKFIREAYKLMLNADEERTRLFNLIDIARDRRTTYSSLDFLDSNSPIQGVIVKGNEFALTAERLLIDSGLFARAIRAPTVPVGSERIRVCLHSFNTADELADAFSRLDELVTSRTMVLGGACG